MGRSYTSQAFHTIEALVSIVTDSFTGYRDVFTFEDQDYFIEWGPQRKDDGISGKIHKLGESFIDPQGLTRCPILKSGSFSVSPDGTIKRFAYIPSKFFKKAQEMAPMLHRQAMYG